MAFTASLKLFTSRLMQRKTVDGLLLLGLGTLTAGVVTLEKTSSYPATLQVKPRRRPGKVPK